MKNRIFSVFRNKYLYILLFAAVTFSACKKENVATTPTSGLMAFNLIPDSTQPVAFVLDNNTLANAPIGFDNFTGGYLDVFSGPRTIKLYESNSDSALASTSYTFQPGMYYSTFAMGANGNYKNLIVADNLDSLPTSTGNAFVRYVNAIPDSSGQTITVSTNGSDVINTNTSFGEVSDFTGIAPADISISVKNGSTISADKTISLQKDKVYTLLLTGMPNAPDTAKAVKIKYIINGTVTP
jgi:hypothetical protein